MKSPVESWKRVTPTDAELAAFAAWARAAHGRSAIRHTMQLALRGVRLAPFRRTVK